MTKITAAIAHRKGKLEGIVTKALQAFVINGLASIHGSPEAKMTPTTYMELYTAISELINREEYTDTNTRGNLLYKAVSNFLAEYLQSVAQKLESQDDSALLSAYFAEWDRYTASATKVDHLLRHLNEHHIQGKAEKGKKGIYPIRLLHFVHWRSQVWQKIASRINGCAEQALRTNTEYANIIFDMYNKWAEAHPTCKDGHLLQLSKSLEAPFVDEVREHEIKVAKIAFEIARARAERAEMIAQDAGKELRMLEEGHDSMEILLHGEPIGVMYKSEEDVDDIMQSPSYATLGGETVSYVDLDVGRYFGQLS
ncbi:hypothetical protein FPSE_10829 [Fusarium pseudograminearum CS3096]|uniref:Cullin N-terminal domain-containing protein n=1 Tax=Fusarium pseudograminearum (strain CS3096) TaxID=1028729 RepID=K3VXJ0_FUSPC|nr:hypothetical protein FPSE_10829 [Fusarium pseudograminearum CS3096]EKJ68985.1 hypothetical protein FPSE_10829 [Fusarium pseudograminearum CS3096]KAF0643035.1 hypothetical protein FPSE5266_10829 [Fusarium pseudograminearum]